MMDGDSESGDFERRHRLASVFVVLVGVALVLLIIIIAAVIIKQQNAHEDVVGADGLTAAEEEAYADLRGETYIEIYQRSGAELDEYYKERLAELETPALKGYLTIVYARRVYNLGEAERAFLILDAMPEEWAGCELGMVKLRYDAYGDFYDQQGESVKAFNEYWAMGDYMLELCEEETNE